MFEVLVEITSIIFLTLYLRVPSLLFEVSILLLLAPRIRLWLILFMFKMYVCILFPDWPLDLVLKFILMGQINYFLFTLIAFCYSIRKCQWFDPLPMSLWCPDLEIFLCLFSAMWIMNFYILPPFQSRSYVISNLSPASAPIL